MNLTNDRTSTKRRFLLSIIPAFFCSNVLANTLKKYLKRPLQIIFPIPFAGSINREIPMRMFDQTGVDYYFENKLGASGLIATKFIKEDTLGHSIMIVSNTIMISNFLQNKDKVGHDYRDIFKCIGAMYSTPFVLVTKSGNNLDVGLSDFLNLAKKRQLTYSITGYFDIPHLCGSMLSHSLGNKLLAVPYKNSHLLPVISGEVDFTFASLSAVMPHLSGRQVSGIAHTSSQQIDVFPLLPSLAKIIDFQSIDSTFGIVASRHMSDKLLYEISNQLNQVLSDEEYRFAMKRNGVNLHSINSPSDYDKYLRNEQRKYEKIMRLIG